jgi:cytochrome c1
MTTWTISTLERELSDGGVVIAHWRATAVDGDFSASSYGTCGFTPDPSASGFIAYDSLTEEDVIGWVQAAVDKYEIEASLAAQIEEDKNPTQAAGVPW